MKAMIRRTLVVLSLAAGASCATHKQAIEVTGAIAASTPKARQLVDQLEQADAAQVAAHRTTREALRNALGNLQAEALKLARARLATEVAVSRGRIDRELDTNYRGLLEARRAAGDDLSKLFEAAWSKVDQAEQRLADEAEAALGESQRFPDDRALYIKRLETQRTYLAFAAKSRDSWIRAQERAERAMDDVLLASLAELERVAESHRQKLRELASKGEADLGLQPVPIDLGPDPVSSKGAYDGLRQYVAAVDAGALALKNHLEASSWFGSESNFAEFLQAFGSGALGGLVSKDASGVSWKDVKDSAKDALGAAFVSPQELLADARSTVSEAFAGVLDQARSKLAAAAEKEIRDVAGTIQQ